MTRENVKGLIEINALAEEIECLMCLDLINDPRICIHCSAIVCAKCIENWLKRSDLCPKCSQQVQLSSFVQCRLARRLVDLIERASNDHCLIHPTESSKTLCRTCQISVCSRCLVTNGEHINHDYGKPNEDYEQISRLNKKLLDFLRNRLRENQEKFKKMEGEIENLCNNHDRNVQKTEMLIDEIQQTKQVLFDAMKEDELIINDIERRLMRCQYLSDQEEILEILQQHVPSTK